eukprot:TRINITY_DN636_c0_g1_i7.p1 TRINITY_DN636_c0_g1~~TRINITY_DN636_c0_g1_i7.p1  ORF type:complete len:1914 (-),score=863.67 TRINITY_DN636_c0_g1_i7:144-5885(-)
MASTETLTNNNTFSTSSSSSSSVSGEEGRDNGTLQRVSSLIVKSRSTGGIAEDDADPSSIFGFVLQRSTSKSHMKEDCFLSVEEESQETASIPDEDSTDNILLNIKTDSTTFYSRKQDKGSSSRAACRVFNNRSLIRIEVKKTYTIWMIKCIIFDQMGAHFDPPSITLYTAENLELKNEMPLSSYATITSSSTLVAVPAEPKSAKGGEKKSTVVDLLTGKSSYNKIHVPNTFAVGRGLVYGVVGYSTSFTIFPVNKWERYINLHCEFLVIIEKLEVHTRTRRRLNDIHISFHYDKSNGTTTVSYTPTEEGQHLVTILHKKQHICLSPYQLTVKKVDLRSAEAPRVIKELAFFGWDVEAANILANMSDDFTLHDKIFEVGIKGVLMHLMNSQDSNIQCDMMRVFTNLITRDEHKVKIMNDAGLDLIMRIMCNPYWHSNNEVSQFVGRMCCFALETSPPFRKKFLEVVGVAPLFTLADLNDNMCSRYASSSLVHLSSSMEDRLMLLENPLLSEAVNSLIQHSDPSTQRLAFQVIANLCQEEPFYKSINARKVAVIVKIAKNTSSQTTALEAIRILGLLQHRCVVETFINDNGYEALYPHFHLDDGLQWWEFGMLGVGQEYALSHSIHSESQRQSSFNFFALRYLNNVLGRSTRDELFAISRHIVSDFPFVVASLCKLASITDRKVQKEAAAAVKQLAITEEFRELALKTGLIWMLASLSSIPPETTIELLQAIAQISSSFNRNTKLPGDDASIVVPLFKLLYSVEQSIQRYTAIILGHLLRSERYRAGLIQSGPSAFLPLVFDAVREGEVTTHEKIPFDSLEIMHEIAPGAGNTKVFEVVYEGRRCALKRFDVNDLAFNLKEFRSEMLIASALRHKRIANCLGGSTAPPNLFIVSKLYAKGSLAQIVSNVDVELPLPIIISMMIDAASGLQFLHSLDIVHRDIKPGNLLVNDKWRVSLTDFGTTRCIDTKKRMSVTVGTAMYMAPEIVDQGNYTTAIDVYSLAIVMWEMLERRAPYPEHMGAIEVVMACKQGQRPVFTGSHPASLKALIERCWSTEPERRPKADQIVTALQELASELKRMPSLTLRPPAAASTPSLSSPTSAVFPQMPSSSRPSVRQLGPRENGKENAHQDNLSRPSLSLSDHRNAQGSSSSTSIPVPGGIIRASTTSQLAPGSPPQTTKPLVIDLKAPPSPPADASALETGDRKIINSLSSNCLNLASSSTASLTPSSSKSSSRSRHGDEKRHKKSKSSSSSSSSEVKREPRDKDRERRKEKKEKKERDEKDPKETKDKKKTKKDERRVKKKRSISDNQEQESRDRIDDSLHVSKDSARTRSLSANQSTSKTDLLDGTDLDLPPVLPPSSVDTVVIASAPSSPAIPSSPPSPDHDKDSLDPQQQTSSSSSSSVDEPKVEEKIKTSDVTEVLPVGPVVSNPVPEETPKIVSPSVEKPDNEEPTEGNNRSRASTSSSDGPQESEGQEEKVSKEIDSVLEQLDSMCNGSATSDSDIDITSLSGGKYADLTAALFDSSDPLEMPDPLDSSLSSPPSSSSVLHFRPPITTSDPEPSPSIPGDIEGEGDPETDAEDKKSLRSSGSDLSDSGSSDTPDIKVTSKSGRTLPTPTKSWSVADPTFNQSSSSSSSSPSSSPSGSPSTPPPESLSKLLSPRQKATIPPVVRLDPHLHTHLPLPVAHQPSPHYSSSTSVSIPSASATGAASASGVAPTSHPLVQTAAVPTGSPPSPSPSPSPSPASSSGSSSSSGSGIPPKKISPRGLTATPQGVTTGRRPSNGFAGGTTSGSPRPSPSFGTVTGAAVAKTLSDTTNGSATVGPSSSSSSSSSTGEEVHNPHIKTRTKSTAELRLLFEQSAPAPSPVKVKPLPNINRAIKRTIPGSSSSAPSGPAAAPTPVSVPASPAPSQPNSQS